MGNFNWGECCGHFCQFCLNTNPIANRKVKRSMSEVKAYPAKDLELRKNLQTHSEITPIPRLINIYRKINTNSDACRTSLYIYFKLTTTLWQAVEGQKLYFDTLISCYISVWKTVSCLFSKYRSSPLIFILNYCLLSSLELRLYNGWAAGLVNKWRSRERTGCQRRGSNQEQPTLYVIFIWPPLHLRQNYCIYSLSW